MFQVPAGRSLDEVMARLPPIRGWKRCNAISSFRGSRWVHNDLYAPLQYGAQLIRADLAHRWATGKGVHVAVIDTGVEDGASGPPGADRPDHHIRRGRGADL